MTGNELHGIPLEKLLCCELLMKLPILEIIMGSKIQISLHSDTFFLGNKQMTINQKWGTNSRIFTPKVIKKSPTEKHFCGEGSLKKRGKTLQPLKILEEPNVFQKTRYPSKIACQTK